MFAPPAEALTIPAIARALNVPVHRVEWIVLSRAIAPCARAAHVRVFDETARDRIARELAIIDERQAP